MKRPDSFISPHRLEELKQNPEVLPKVLDAFLDESLRLVNDIKEFTFEREPLNVMRVAHSLNHYSSNVGAVYMADISKQIEIKAKNEDLSEMDRLIRCLEEGHEQTRKVVNGLRNR